MAAADRSLAAAALAASAVAVAALAVAAPVAEVDLESRHAIKHRLQTTSLNLETNMLLVVPTLARTAEAYVAQHLSSGSSAPNQLALCKAALSDVLHSIIIWPCEAAICCGASAAGIQRWGCLALRVHDQGT